MTKKFALIACLLLAGCTDADWDNVMNFGPSEPKPVPVRTTRPAAAAAPAAIAAAPEPANAEFCRAVATQDAASNSTFDQATQRRIFTQSYTQCLAISYTP